MFTRALFGHDMIAQQRLLSRTADLVDRGALRTTATKTLTGIDADTVRGAHRDVESGPTIGKIVLVR